LQVGLGAGVVQMVGDLPDVWGEKYCDAFMVSAPRPRDARALNVAKRRL
jgi:hypothetical protein